MFLYGAQVMPRRPGNHFRLQALLGDCREDRSRLFDGAVSHCEHWIRAAKEAFASRLIRALYGTLNKTFLCRPVAGYGAGAYKPAYPRAKSGVATPTMGK
jgi:hypothetical protein